MEESIRIWRESGLEFLFQPSSKNPLPVHNKKGHTGNVHVNDLQSMFPEPFHFYINIINYPVRIVWTYRELDQDMRGQPDHQRLTLWNSILSAKKWQANQVTYWPVVLLDEVNFKCAQNCMPFFYRFLEYARPTVVLCFGNAAHKLLQAHGGADLPPSTQLLFLPGADEMLPDNKVAKKNAWELIRPLKIYPFD